MKETKLYIHISSGRGPAECCWVAARLLKEIIVDCETKKLVTNVIEHSKGTENGTINSALVLVSGHKVKSKLESWTGTIQWIGKSPYRKFHKRKNWFVKVAFIYQNDATSYKAKDIIYKSYRASGPGGQHRNKVETAIRATHIPTGLVATATESRSQAVNKQTAIKKLKFLIENQKIVVQKQRIDDQWQQTTSLERGNPVRVYEGLKFKLKHKISRS